MAEWCKPIWVTFNLTLTSASFLGFSCLEHISYITANFPRMCFLLDLFLWGHLSRDCDISCYVSIKAAFHLGLHCLPKYLFIGIHNERVKGQNVGGGGGEI